MRSRKFPISLIDAFASSEGINKRNNTGRQTKKTLSRHETRFWI
jgi:hypothetical protein